MEDAGCRVDASVLHNRQVQHLDLTPMVQYTVYVTYLEAVPLEAWLRQCQCTCMTCQQTQLNSSPTQQEKKKTCQQTQTILTL